MSVDEVSRDPDNCFAIVLDRVTKVFAGAPQPAVDNLSISIPAGAITVLVGPSGCGKTTALKMINRLIEPTSGHIQIFGEPIATRAAHELRRQIGYVIQHTGLFPHRTIATNIATVPRLLGWPKPKINARVTELTELVGLEPDILTRYPSELSGGQQQRVGVARALAADPPVLLMDEPYSAVDPIVRAHLQDELLSLQTRLKKTIVMVSHDIDEAVKLGDRIAILNIGAELAQFGPPEELLRAPASPFVEQFLGAERGLKRLALIRVRDVTLSTQPAVEANATTAEARDAATRAGTEWVAVVDGRQLIGWCWIDEIEAAGGVAGIPPRRFLTTATPDTTLREALDHLVTSQTRVAAVVDQDGSFLGILGIEQLGDGLQ